MPRPSFSCFVTGVLCKAATVFAFMLVLNFAAIENTLTGEMP